MSAAAYSAVPSNDPKMPARVSFANASPVLVNAYTGAVLEVHAAVLRLLVAGTLTADRRMHGVLLVCAIHAALTAQPVQPLGGPSVGCSIVFLQK